MRDRQDLFTQMYRVLYGDASEGNQHGGPKKQKHLSLSFAIETKGYYSRAPTY